MAANRRNETTWHEGETISDIPTTGSLIRLPDGSLIRARRIASPLHCNDPWVDYDPEEVRKAIDAYAGSWGDVDADTMIDRIHQSREEGSRQRFQDDD